MEGKGGAGGCESLGWDPKGQNRRLAGPGDLSLTLVAALAQLQGDDLPGHRFSDEGAPARPGQAGVTAGTNAWQPDTQDVRSARSLRLLTRMLRLRVCSAGLPSAGGRGAQPGHLLPHSSCSWNSAQAQSEATPPPAHPPQLRVCVVRLARPRGSDSVCGRGGEGRAIQVSGEIGRAHV